jgi:hypothetical protein
MTRARGLHVEPAEAKEALESRAWPGRGRAL